MKRLTILITSIFILQSVHGGHSFEKCPLQEPALRPQAAVCSGVNLSGLDEECIVRDLLNFDHRGSEYRSYENLLYKTLESMLASEDSKGLIALLASSNEAIRKNRESILDAYRISGDNDAINLIDMPHERIIAEMLFSIADSDKAKRSFLQLAFSLALQPESNLPLEIKYFISNIINNYGIGEIYESATECNPFYAEGGVATVMGQYPQVAARECGLDIKTVLPLYRLNRFGHYIREHTINNYHLRWTGKNIDFAIDGQRVTVGIYNAYVNGQVVIFLDHPIADSIYIKHKGGSATALDHCLSRVFMAKGLLEVIDKFKRNPKFIIANDDWTALVNFYKQEHADYKNNPRIKGSIPITRWHNPGADYHVEVPYVEGDRNLFEVVVDDENIINDNKKSWEIQQAFRHPFQPDSMSFAAIGARYSNNLAVSKGLADAMADPIGRTGLHPIFGQPENRPLTGIHEGIDQVSLQKQLFGAGFAELVNTYRMEKDQKRREALRVRIISVLNTRKTVAKGDLLMMYFPYVFSYYDTFRHNISAGLDAILKGRLQSFEDRIVRGEKSAKVPVILFMGRIVRQKGWQYLFYHMRGDTMNVLQRIVTEYPDARFIFAGNPGDSIGQWVQNELIRMSRSKESPWRKNIFVRDQVSYGSLEWLNLILGADSGGMPSINEPCGMFNLEAESAGTLVCSSNIEGLLTGVIDFDEDPDEGNGFKFSLNFDDSYNIDPSSAAKGLYKTLRSFLEAFYYQGKPGGNEILDSIRFNAATTDNRWEPRINEFIMYMRELSGIKPIIAQELQNENSGKGSAMPATLPEGIPTGIISRAYFLNSRGESFDDALRRARVKIEFLGNHGEGVITKKIPDPRSAPLISSAEEALEKQYRAMSPKELSSALAKFINKGWVPTEWTQLMYKAVANPDESLLIDFINMVSDNCEYLQRICLLASSSKRDPDLKLLIREIFRRWRRPEGAEDRRTKASSGGVSLITTQNCSYTTFVALMKRYETYTKLLWSVEFTEGDAVQLRHDFELFNAVFSEDRYLIINLIYAGNATLTKLAKVLNEANKCEFVFDLAPHIKLHFTISYHSQFLKSLNDKLKIAAIAANEGAQSAVEFARSRKSQLLINAAA